MASAKWLIISFNISILCQGLNLHAGEADKKTGERNEIPSLIAMSQEELKSAPKEVQKPETYLENPKVKAFIQQYSSFEKITPQDNAAFIQQEQAPTAKLFFETKNAFLKIFNDVIYQDKNLSDATEICYKDIFYENLLKNPLLKSQLAFKYADYKSLRFGFNEDTPEMRTALTDVYEKSARQFSAKIKELGIDNVFKWGAAKGLLPEDPINWNLAGMGATPDEVGVTIRMANDRLPKQGKSKLVLPVHFSQVQAQFQAKLVELEKIREGLQSEIGTANGMMVPSTVDSKKLVLSSSADEFLRKSSDPDEIASELKKRFGINLSKAQAEKLIRYYALADELSMDVLIEKRNAPIDLGQAQNGIVSADFTAIGAKNIASTMDSLVAAEGSNPDAEKAIKEASKGFAQATKHLQDLKDSFRSAVAAIGGNEKNIYFSGDDGVYFPEKPLTSDQKITLIDTLVKRGFEGGSFRMTFLPEKYTNGEAIPTTERSLLIVTDENLEKNTRKAFEGKIAFSETQKFTLAVDVEPYASGGGKVNLIVAGETGGNLEKITEAFKASLPQGYTFGKIMQVKPAKIPEPEREPACRGAY